MWRGERRGKPLIMGIRSIYVCACTYMCTYNPFPCFIKPPPNVKKITLIIIRIRDPFDFKGSSHFL